MKSSEFSQSHFLEENRFRTNLACPTTPAHQSALIGKQSPEDKMGRSSLKIRLFLSDFEIIFTSIDWRVFSNYLPEVLSLLWIVCKARLIDLILIVMTTEYSMGFASLVTMHLTITKNSMKHLFIAGHVFSPEN